MDPFYGPGGRRAIEPEIRARIAEQIGATPIDGWAKVIDVGGAATDDKRMSGYRERGSFREWLLPLSAKKGLSWQTATVPQSPLGKVAFFLSMGFGNGSPLPQPSGQWDLFVNDRLAVSIRVVNHSQLWRQGECSFAFAANRIETAPAFCSMTLSDLITDEAFAAFGPAALTVPTSWVLPGEPATLRLVPRAEADSTRWVQLTTSAGMFVGSDVYRAVDVLTGRARARIGDYNIYFGDIHTHSGQGDVEGRPVCGVGSREQSYRYARGPGGLDFYALTDHEWQIDPGRTGEYLGLADEFNEDGCFVCLPAFEHTSLLYGHRNVYFRGPGGTVVNTNREGGMITMDPDKVISPHELWAALESNGAPFMTVPHHPDTVPDVIHNLVERPQRAGAARLWITRRRPSISLLIGYQFVSRTPRCSHGHSTLSPRGTPEDYRPASRFLCRSLRELRPTRAPYQVDRSQDHGVRLAKEIRR